MLHLKRKTKTTESPSRRLRILVSLYGWPNLCRTYFKSLFINNDKSQYKNMTAAIFCDKTARHLIKSAWNIWLRIKSELRFIIEMLATFLCNNSLKYFFFLLATIHKKTFFVPIFPCQSVKKIVIVYCAIFFCSNMQRWARCFFFAKICYKQCCATFSTTVF